MTQQINNYIPNIKIFLVIKTHTSLLDKCRGFFTLPYSLSNLLQHWLQKIKKVLLTMNIKEYELREVSNQMEICLQPRNSIDQCLVPVWNIQIPKKTIEITHKKDYSNCNNYCAETKAFMCLREILKFCFGR